MNETRDCVVKHHTCNQQFRIGDIVRHKCIEKRQRPVNEQKGAVKHEKSCQCLFWSKGGSVHWGRKT